MVEVESTDPPRDAGRRPMEAYLLIETDRETGPIAGFLRGVPGVLLAQDVRGPYDALALARSDPGGRGLERTLAERLGIRGDPEYVRGACEASLARLGVDHIDLYGRCVMDRRFGTLRVPVAQQRNQ